jgi:4-hydroxybenzoate polyprenyltransferase
MKLLHNLATILQLIRWKNLILLLIAQSIFYLLLLFPTVKFTRIPPSFYYLMVATLSIAAAGYIINDFFDIVCDRINKPKKTYITTHISKKRALYLYGILNFIGLYAGIQLCILLEKGTYSIVFLSIVFSLYAYSKYLKKTPLVGNILVSILVVSNTLILYYFPFGEPVKETTLLLQFSLFAFCINILREMVKDLEDINGDYNAGMRTLPIVLGRERSIKVILSFTCITVFLFIRFCLVQLDEKTYFQVTFFLTIIAPLFYFMMQLHASKTKGHFNKMSLLLKRILIVGLLFITLLCYIN